MDAQFIYKHGVNKCSIDLRLCIHKRSNAYFLKLTNEMVCMRKIENNNVKVGSRLSDDENLPFLSFWLKPLAQNLGFNRYFVRSFHFWGSFCNFFAF